MYKYLKYITLIIPAIFLWTGLNFTLAKFGNDPNYVYLLNALAICNGKDVGYTDHPGTTVIQTGAVAVAALNAVSNPENKPLAQHVLTDPHKFVMGIRNVLLFLNAIGLILLGWLAFKKTGSVWIALLLQASVFITANTLDHVWTKISPEPFLFFLTNIYTIAILFYYYKKKKNSWKYVVVFSLLAGAGLATKVTFLPLIVLPFVVIRSVKKKFLYLAGIIPSFVLFTIPIISEYENMYYWLRDLTTHSGIYGHGEKGFIDFNTYFPNIIRIIENNLIFAVVLFTGFLIVLPRIILSMAGKKALSLEIRYLSGLVASMALGVLMVAKHYHSNHYLIPVLLLTGISVFFILTILLNTKLPERIKKMVWPVVTTGLILFLVWKQPLALNYIEYGYQITNEEMDRTNAMIESEYSDYTRIYYYPNSLNPYSALNFGDVYCKRQYLPLLKKLYPNTFFYHSFEKKIQNWNTEIQLSELVNIYGNKVMLTGGPFDENEVKEISNSGFPLHNIYKGRIQRIYVLDTFRFNELIRSVEKNLEEVLYCDMEQVSSDNQFIMSAKGEKIGRSFLRTQEKARSGNHSVKLDETTEYALEYRLTGLKQGEEYEVEVWRNAANDSGRLVVSSSDARLFYQAQSDFAITGKNGWQLLRINFTVTPEIQDETLKVYLWNKDKKTGYFDDFAIRKKPN